MVTMDTVPEEGGLRSGFVPITRVGDATRARILAALLESEGIEVRLHSESFGPYPVTVGDMATTELWVPERRVDDARRVLLDSEILDAVGEDDGAAAGGPMLELRFVAALLIVVFVLAVLVALRVF